MRMPRQVQDYIDQLDGSCRASLSDETALRYVIVSIHALTYSVESVEVLESSDSYRPQTLTLEVVHQSYTEHTTAGKIHAKMLRAVRRCVYRITERDLMGATQDRHRMPREIFGKGAK